MINTGEEAAKAGLGYGVLPDFDAAALHVVNLETGWRVFYGARARYADGTFVGPRSQFCPYPLFVERSTGEVRVEYTPATAGLSAQAAYKAMFKSEVGPDLRKFGFRGTGLVYRLPVPDHFASVGFRISRGSTWACAQIEGLVSVIPKQVWDHRRARYGGMSAPSATHFDSERTRQFGADWVVYAGVTTHDLASEIVTAVRDRALPWIHALLRSGDPGETGLIAPHP